MRTLTVDPGAVLAHLRRQYAPGVPFRLQELYPGRAPGPHPVLTRLVEQGLLGRRGEGETEEYWLLPVTRA